MIQPEPFHWNVVVMGAWNPAILSPDGIRRRLFRLAQNTPIELELAVDRPGYFRVIHDGVVVAPTTTSLEIVTRIPDLSSLRRACELGARALEELPETPVTAAGVNIRYQFAELPNSLLDLITGPLDTTLSDGGFQIGKRSSTRTLNYGSGFVNIQLSDAGTSGTLEFNFHRESAVPGELREWLDKAVEFVELSEKLASMMGVNNVGREIHV